jgi:hypothetical protein
MIEFTFGANCARLNRADAAPLPLRCGSPDPATGVSGIGTSAEDRLLIVSIGPLSVCPDVSTRSVPAGLSELAYCAAIWRLISQYRAIIEISGFSVLSFSCEASGAPGSVSARFAAGESAFGFRRERGWLVELFGGSNEIGILRTVASFNFSRDFGTAPAFGNISTYS